MSAHINGEHAGTALIAEIAGVPLEFLATPEAQRYLAEMRDAIRALDGMDTNAEEAIVAFSALPEVRS